MSSALIAFAGQPIGLAMTGFLLQAFNPLVTVLAFMALQAFVTVLGDIQPACAQCEAIVRT